MPATLKGCPVGLGEVGVWEVGELSLYPRGSIFFAKSGLAEQLR